MTDLARYNPFRGLTRFNPFGRDMDDLLTGFFPTPMSLNPMADLHMPIDITEDDKVWYAPKCPASTRKTSVSR